MIIDAMDQISQLPEPIMQKILFLLPAEDAIRMSFLSKTWQSLWNSLHVSNFDFDFDQMIQINRDRKRKRGSTSNKPVTTVDESLRILHEHEDQKRIIHFSLKGSTLCYKKKNYSHLDRWIKLVTENNYVRVINLNLSNIMKDTTRYSFPPTTFDVGSLVELSLSFCTLDKAIIQKGTRFSCLKELHLFWVDLNGSVVGEFLSRCPSLETLRFVCCINIKHLHLCELPKLKKVSFIQVGLADGEYYIYRYKIEASNLQTLCYYTRNNLLDIEAVNCSNLKELTISPRTSTIITNQYIQKLTYKFPFLEELVLLSVKLPEMKIVSHQLKKLTIHHNSDSYVKEVYLDTPNLVFYKYKGHEIPTWFSLNSSKLEEVDIDLSNKHSTPFHTPWFLTLRDYLANFASCEGMTVRIKLARDTSPKMITFSLDELREEEIPPLSPKAKLLSVVDVPSSPDDTHSLIDGLLWSCHPITLSLERPKHQYPPPNDKLIKLIYDKLMWKEKNHLCCGESHIKCWWHCLKSIKVQSFSRFWQYGETLSKPLQTDFEEVSEIVFELQWMLET